MLTDDEVQKSDLFIKALSQRIRQFPAEYQSCSLHAVTRGSELLYCLIRLGVVPKGKDVELNYGSIQLRYESFSCEDFLSRLGTMFSSGSYPVGALNLPVRITQFRAYQNYHESHSQYHDWPGLLYVLGNPDNINLQSDPLVAHGLTPYFDVTDAITHWIGIGGRRSGNSLSLGMITLFLPRFDAKLDNMEFTGGKLKVHCTVTSPDLHLAILAADANKTFRSSKPLRKTQSIKLMPNPEKLKVLIVNAESEVIDQFTETEQGASRNRVIFAGARYSTELMETIRHGETDKVEFKEFIRLDDKRDKKVNDIVKSVAAFSNTTGGTILVGIADDAEVLGINDQFPHDRKKAETFVGDYFQKVRELLKDRLNRIPFVDMHAELFGDKTVLVIRVEEGSAKPYLDIQTKDVLIRRGASNVRADENDLRLIFGRGELQDSMGWNQNGSISW
jgi:hypothetical protein